MIKVKTTHYGQDYATIEISNGKEKHEIETTIALGEAVDKMNKQGLGADAPKAEIHKITWNGQTYFKVYAENLNGRMILATKSKFEDQVKAKEFMKIMLPSHRLAKQIREVKF